MCVCVCVCVCMKPSWVALVVKTPPASAGGIRDVGCTTGSGRLPGGGYGNPL